jgi:hypothetical protein
VQLLTVFSQVAQLAFQEVHTLLIGTSSVLVQEASQVFDVVTTKFPEQEVQVATEEAQVRHEESQAKHWFPLSIVLSTSQESSQVLVRKSSFLFDTQDVH